MNVSIVPMVDICLINLIIQDVYMNVLKVILEIIHQIYVKIVVTNAMIAQKLKIIVYNVLMINIYMKKIIVV